MAEVAEPVTRLLGPRPVGAAAEVHEDFEVLVREDLGGAGLVDGLGFAVHDERERWGAVGWDEGDGCAGGDDGPGGGEALRVADGAEDAAPVGVFAVQRGFDEGVAGDGCGDEFRVGEGGRVGDFDPYEFGRSFAVSDDELGELLRKGGEDGLHCGPVFRGGRRDGLAAAGAVGEDGEGVVGAGAAVYAYGVEGALGGVGEEGSEGRGWDGSVGAQDAEERGHVWMDHAGTFGHSRY